jgi:hypothetical protein
MYLLSVVSVIVPTNTYEYHLINNHVNLNNAIHLGVTKVIDGTITETTDNKYIQTIESIRTLPSQLKDSKKRTFIDNHNYLYAHNSNVQSYLHYNYTFIPPLPQAQPSQFSVPFKPVSMQMMKLLFLTRAMTAMPLQYNWQGGNPFIFI